MKNFRVGDIVAYNYPAAGECGPWSGSGLVVTAEPGAFKIEVRSNHSGINYWRPVDYCTLIGVARNAARESASSVAYQATDATITD